MKNYKEIRRWIPAFETTDGDGVKIFRVAGQNLATELDPYLLIDELRSDDSKDYIGGFPSHPHRGFQTITYMKDGLVRHRDHMGNEGVIGSGGLQWMSAGRGVIHSEMPEQEDGLFHGFQIWLNLPAKEKMSDPDYRDIGKEETTRLQSSEKVSVNLVAGKIEVEDKAFQGPLQIDGTEAIYLDIEMPANSSLEFSVSDGMRVHSYVYDGQANEIHSPALAIFDDQGSEIKLTAGSEGARLLVFGGFPINEPVVQHGPFVMNTEEEIHQAFSDYQQGTLTI